MGLGLFAIGLGLSLQAAPARADSVSPELRIYLVTFDSGSEIWERFGHNALWVHDPENGTDVAYDYGRFSFQSERFFYRFAKGDLRYWMGQADVRAVVAAYERAHRSIWVQELDLPLPARAALRDFLRWNIQESNKYYQYNYYTDNCSTRIRDAIDRVLGGQLGRWARAVPTTMTFRDHTRRLTENTPLFHSLLALGLGQPVDHRLSAWEEMFLPISLRPYLDSVSVTDPDGRTHKLVKTERHVALSDRFPVPATPHDWAPGYLLAGVVLGGVLAGLGRLGQSSSAGRLAFGIGATGWAFFAGVAGLALAALWAFTTHRFSYRNENLFQVSLLSLALAAVLPKAVWGSMARRRWGLVAAGLVVGLGLLGLLLKLTPPFNQANLDVVGFVLPVHLGLLAGLKVVGPRVP
jgi:uncharacterized protein DUF4105